MVAVVALVTWRGRGPQPPGRSGPETAQHPDHNAARGPFDGQLLPDVALAPAYKRPQLIEFQRFGLAALSLFRPATWQLGQDQRRFF